VIANQVAGLFGSPYIAPVGDFESIATTTLSSSQSSVTFSPTLSGYKHLQLRYLVKGVSSEWASIQFNSDSGNNYSRHNLSGNGSSASAGGAANSNGYTLFIFYSTAFTAGITDILDFSNTNKYKTVRTLSGWDNNGSGDVNFTSQAWLNTAAITSITISSNGANFASGSTFALYGVK